MQQLKSLSHTFSRCILGEVFASDLSTACNLAAFFHLPKV